MFETEERRSRIRRRISIKLVSSCWSCSSNTNNKIVEIWVEEENIVKLELICVALGLDPCQPQAATLKLNRHLISSSNSSLTWKSLLSFFASRGLPIGSSSNDPLIIHYGNHLHLLPQTKKRGHDPCCTQNCDTYSSGIKQNAEPEDVNFFKKQKIDNNNAGTHISSSGRDGDHQTTRFNGLSLKRKPTVEDVSMFMLKKRKLNEGNPGNQSSTPNTISESQLGCSCISGSKRPREGS
ncbi:hypothetical protein AQUCO_10800048v1 [Aquilegia coerulea]|uniref:Uncharacterized protein n=1 Tax=Aquilegia coerulea TaxID=218851 RepID=A0A2G5C3I3_AQUCA|nr:hypothetical protein AQUCO_10800048v1 [Aquilegia coerulea]